ncbi:hypothetical protein ACFTWS_06330 [Streptomyces sp. NPDC057027]|uniref:hypothetical protein n=1 Tax=Streptomyces sp. NPDC057027 TaxID=3346004 RepID=UPI0036379384
MKKSVSWAVTIATVATCGLGVAAPAMAADADPAASAATATAAATGGLDTSTLDPKLKALVDGFVAKLPADWQTRLQAAYGKTGAGDTLWAEIRDAGIDPNAYQCQSTQFRAVVGKLYEGINNPFGFELVRALGFLDLPMYEALLFGEDSKANAYGLNGEYTQEITSTMKDLKSFWDIKSSDIQLVPMKNDIYSSPERMGRVIAVLYGVDEAVATEFAAQFFPQYFAMEPFLRNGSNPLLTLNAFAYSEEGEPHPMGISDRIVMGDGILEVMKEVGLGDVAPKAIMAHEFGHHVQYEDHLFSNTTLTGPEATRRTELMADAFGTYYLTHAQGEALNSKRLLDSEKNFYEIGDCGFLSPGHHGTPNQRLASSTWGASVAAGAANQGHILPSLGFSVLFDAKLPDLVKPDAV